MPLISPDGFTAIEVTSAAQQQFMWEQFFKAALQANRIANPNVSAQDVIGWAELDANVAFSAWLRVKKEFQGRNL